MRRSSLFGHITELLDLIVPSRQPADIIVKDFFRRRHYLGSRDRRFISDHLYGILRHYMYLDVLCRRALTDFGSNLALKRSPAIGLCAAYVLHVVGEDQSSLEPDVAGIWRTTTSDIRPSDFLAALRKAVIPQDVLSNPAGRISVLYSMPEPIVKEWLERFGAQEAEELCAASNVPAPTTLRVNTLRASVEDCQEALAREQIEAKRTRVSPHGLVLDKRVNIQSLRTFKEGFFEPQDEGSQLISLLMGVKAGDRVVDACAGAGGKTLHLAALMHNNGVLLAMDTSDDRLGRLRARVARAGVTIVNTSVFGEKQSLPAGWLESADSVLVDAPCSGVGIFRRNPGAKLQFSASALPSINKTQAEVLDRSATLVGPGGRLVYSTCTLFRSENEEIIEGFLAHHPQFALLSAPDILRSAGATLDDTGPYLLLMPHRHGTDGFFAAVMQQSAD
jgi:16S rRNA (cytosine967-C5)-methyltransferase